MPLRSQVGNVNPSDTWPDVGDMNGYGGSGLPTSLGGVPGSPSPAPSVATLNYRVDRHPVTTPAELSSERTGQVMTNGPGETDRTRLRRRSQRYRTVLGIDLG